MYSTRRLTFALTSMYQAVDNMELTSTSIHSHQVATIIPKEGRTVHILCSDYHCHSVSCLPCHPCLHSLNHSQYICMYWSWSWSWSGWSWSKIHTSMAYTAILQVEMMMIELLQIEQDTDYPNIQSTPDKVEIRDTFSSFDAVGYFVEYLGLINALWVSPMRLWSILVVPNILKSKFSW